VARPTVSSRNGMVVVIAAQTGRGAAATDPRRTVRAVRCSNRPVGAHGPCESHQLVLAHQPVLSLWPCARADVSPRWPRGAWCAEGFLPGAPILSPAHQFYHPRFTTRLTRLELRVRVSGEQIQGAQCHPEQRRAHRSPVPIATQREPRVHRLEHSHHQTEYRQSDSHDRASPKAMVARHGVRMCNIFVEARKVASTVFFIHVQSNSCESSFHAFPPVQ